MFANGASSRDGNDVFSGFGARDWTQEPVTGAGNSLYVTRLFRVVTQDRADLADAEINPPVEVHPGVLSPKSTFDLIAGDDLSSVRHQHDQNSKGLGMYPKLRVTLAKFTLRRV